jgi:predicted acylesterase/phospholipase RssA
MRRISALVCAAAVSLPALAEAPHEPGYSLTLSGGVSLGAYQAGLTWALVRYGRELKQRLAQSGPVGQPRLDAVTGASAGAINALLAAALWCRSAEDGGGGTVDRNSLHDVWLPVGLDELLPRDAATYRDDDGLLTRSALEPTIAEILRRVFKAPPGHYLPGCRVGLGFSVTRERPEERDISGGLRAISQKFVVPLQLEVAADGGVHIRPLPLSGGRESGEAALLLGQSADGTIQPEAVLQGVLASGAFPIAFSPRELCDCAPSCGGDEPVRGGACQGPGPRSSLTGLSCPAAMPGVPRQQLCRRRYVDGGVFDNAPIGLTIDVAESLSEPTALVPSVYLFIDPDLRRFAPGESTPAASSPGSSGLMGGLALLRHLVSTARGADLSRTIRSRSWNRTTPRLLHDGARALDDYVLAHQALALLARGEAGAAASAISVPALDPPAPRHRVRRAAVLLECMTRLPALLPDEPGTLELESCAARAREDPPGEVAAGAVPPERLAALAQLLSSGAVSRDPQRRFADGVIFGSSRGDLGLARRLFTSRLSLGSSAYAFVADEVDRIARSNLPERELELFQGALFDVFAVAPAVSAATRSLYVSIRAQRAPAPGSQEEAAFELLGRFLDRGEAATALVQQGGRELSEQLKVERERELLVVTRFAPLAGSQLYNFAGFLDRPLREVDYYSGIYEAMHTMAVQSCLRQDPYAHSLQRARRRRDAPSELDLEEDETQRCLGAAMREAADWLGVLRSPRALHVAKKLAGAELGAAMGDATRATQLWYEPAWSWLAQAPELSEKDPVAAASAALLSARRSCREGGQELCLAELGFDRFLDALVEARYRPQSPGMQLALADRKQWIDETLQRALDRAAALELAARDENDSIQKDVFLALSAAQLYARRELAHHPTPRLQLDTSTIPGRPLPNSRAWPIAVAHLVPYRAALDVLHGGFALSWLEPALRLTPRLSLMTQLSMIDFDRQRARLSTSALLAPAVHFAGLTLSAGPRFALHWTGDRRGDIGAEVALFGLQDRVGFSLGIREIARERQTFLMLHLADLNGVIYWLTPWGRAAGHVKAGTP